MELKLDSIRSQKSEVEEDGTREMSVTQEQRDECLNLGIFLGLLNLGFIMIWGF
jgi:hypothetical protein